MHRSPTPRPGPRVLPLPCALAAALALSACAEIVPVPDAGLGGGTPPAAPGTGAPPPAGGGVDAAVQPIDARVIPQGDAAPPRDARPPLDQGAIGDQGLTDDGGAPVDLGVADLGAADLAPPVDQAPPDQGCLPEACNGLDDDCDGLIDEDAGCPCPVAQNGTHAYLMCAQGRDWIAARAVCQLTGYDLAVINDAGEDAFVYSELSARGFADSWVGLTDAANEGQWVWLDGEPLVYQHWDQGEPNNGGGNEDCGLIMTTRGRQSEWDDRPCGRSQPFVCEGPAAF